MFWNKRKQDDEVAALEELSKAKNEAKAIIDEASHKAEQIIHETQFFTRKVHEDLRESLRVTSERLAEQNYKQMERVIDMYEQRLAEISKKVESSALEELESFAVETRSHLAKLEEQMGATVLDERAEFEKRFSAQQDEYMKKFAKALSDKLPEIVQELIGEAIPLPDHERIVMDRLAEFKQLAGWR